MKKSYKRTELQWRIKDCLNNNYKVKVNSCIVNPYAQSMVAITATGANRQNMPWMAKRILDRYPQITMVQFPGFVTNVFTKNTLMWGGYYTKINNKK